MLRTEPFARSWWNFWMTSDCGKQRRWTLNWLITHTAQTEHLVNISETTRTSS